MGQQAMAIWHFDFYRFGDPREWEDAGFRDLFAAPGLKLAEWPEKAAAAAEGRDNPLFKGALGMIKNTILHSHENVIRFTDAGVGTNLDASRALFMGRQAGVIAYGMPGGQRFMWQEESDDYGNLMNINAGTIFGVKKTRFNSRDFGLISIDTYAKDPNA